LDELYGTYETPATLKKDYVLPAHIMTNPDVARLINSDEIQSVVRPAGNKHHKRPFTQKKNPLKNQGVMNRLNPYAQVLRRAEIIKAQKIANGKVAKVQKKKPTSTAANKKFLETLHSA
jgi:large subunit ribosomal protein L4e